MALLPIVPNAKGDTMKLKVPIDFGNIIREALKISGADSQQQIQTYDKIASAVISIELGPNV